MKETLDMIFNDDALETVHQLQNYIGYPGWIKHSGLYFILVSNGETTYNEWDFEDPDTDYPFDDYYIRVSNRPLLISDTNIIEDLNPKFILSIVINNDANTRISRLADDLGIEECFFNDSITADTIMKTIYNFINKHYF